MQDEYFSLAIAIHRFGDGYQLELSHVDPTNEAQVAPLRVGASFDLTKLLAAEAIDEVYGKCLADQLFADPEAKQRFVQVETAAQTSNRFLRLSLAIDPSAWELQALRWELLRHPDSNLPLATSERLLFSRFMVSRDWRPIRLRARTELEALIAVSAPPNLAKLSLAPVDFQGEVARATTALAGVKVRTLGGPGSPLTLDRLIEQLRDGADVLYLVSHGMFGEMSGAAALALQDDAGDAVWVKADALAQRIAELQTGPRLIVLASCESAGQGTRVAAEHRSSVEATLAGRLAEAGVPAVLAMQGKISMRTVEAMMPTFFTELLRDGQIDRALAAARAKVRDRPDAWMPALYTRLRAGRLWYTPGFASSGADDEFKKWRSLCDSALAGKIIPVLGPELGEHVFGSSRDLARRLAEDHAYPLAVHERDDLAKVSQFLSITQDRGYTRQQVLESIQQQVLARAGSKLPEGAAALPLPRLLDELVKLSKAELSEADLSDPYRILAALDASVYITASAETLLYKTLEDTDEREPQLLFCEWRTTNESHPRAPEPREPPSKARPIVHHVFGVFPKWDSLVLTEDELFDYLIETSTHKLLPTAVTGALTENSLLFLGFRLDDWRFRALFRMIMRLEGSAGLTGLSHVGVQLDPEDQPLIDRQGAQRYLERYYGAADRAGRLEPKIDIYWGSPGDFLSELWQRLQAVPEAERDSRTALTNPDADEGWF